MRQLLLTLPALLLLVGCNNKNKVKMKEEVKEKVGTIVLVTTQIKSDYTPEKVIELSKAIDPMVDEFEGYLGRKMAFGHTDPNFLVDVVYYTDEKAAAEAAEKEMKSETCNRFFNTMNFETLKEHSFTPAIMTPPKNGNVKAIELVLFKTKPEFSKSEVISAAEDMNTIMGQYDGYVSRKLAVTENGLWMDLVYWTDVEKGKAAAEQILKEGSGQKYFNMIDNNTIEFKHLDVVIDTER